METFKRVSAVLVGAVAAAALVFGLAYGGFEMYKFFAPRYQAVDRQVFENTPSFVQGKEQSLAELRLEYKKAKTEGEKDNIKSMIVNEAATVDINLIKDESLRSFVRDLRSN